MGAKGTISKKVIKKVTEYFLKHEIKGDKRKVQPNSTKPQRD
jgi:hypothetical protein